ncbi:MAG: ATP-binding protein [Cytophagaceae bacterium]
MLNRKYVFLISGVTLILLSILLAFFTKEKRQADKKEILEAISLNINTELSLARKEAKKIKRIIENTDIPVFSTLIQETKYPYFVFRNKQLYFWSDQRYNFAYDLLKDNESLKYLNLKNGKHLVLKEGIIKRGDFFDIYFLIPLTSEFPVENQYLHSSFNKEIFAGYTLDIAPFYDVNRISTTDGRFLFSVTFIEDDILDNSTSNWYVFFLSLTGLIFILFYVGLFVAELNNNLMTDHAFLFLLVVLASIRGIMLVLNYPYNVIEFELFNSKYFASSAIDPSLGDLFLNALFTFVLSAFIYNHYPKSHILKVIHKLDRIPKFLLSVFLIFICNLFVYFFYNILKVLYFDSLWSLDVTVILNFDIFRFVSLSIFILSACIFFIFTHILLRLFISIHKADKISAFAALTAAFLIFILVAFPSGILHGYLVIISFSYFSIILYFNLPKIDYYLRYSTYLYLIIAAMTTSAIGAYAIYDVNVKTSVIGKQKYASSLLMENDVLGEYYLFEATEKIIVDEFIKNKFLEPFTAKDIIEQKVKKLYLNSYLDKYDVEVYSFNVQGSNLEAGTEYPDYFETAQKYKLNEFRTEFSNIFFINDPGTYGPVKYFSFVDIVKNNVVIGYVLIELRHKKILPHSVYPELLMDRQVLSAKNVKNYSYAIYFKNDLIYSIGNFNYTNDLPLSLLDKNELFDNDGLIKNDYHHLGFQAGTDKIVVVSSVKYFLKDSYSNFSFLFLVLIFWVLLIMAYYAFYYKLKNINTTFSTKIQLYLNIAFFLPLFIVSLTTLSVINSNYKRNLNKSFIKKAENVSNNISVVVDKYKRHKMKKEEVEHMILDLARYTDSDINLFNKKGQLIFSNQPMIYESGLFARLVNPVAYSTILENRNNVIMLNEQIGDLKYNAVYVSVKAPDSGDLIGVLSLPFFESKYEVDRQSVEVLTTIINIFTSIFIVFLFLSYMFSGFLIYPLNLITQKIRKTTLSSHNEPLEWNSKDEIGLLVDEYNKMLKKLEESREALSKSEKESAWREMAKQVAHEIKNPLTPMKLIIQHLQRTIEKTTESGYVAMEKSLNTLLDQVNNLSEIATSFSMFAKMPIPKYEKYEIVKVIGSTANLHNSADVQVITGLPSRDIFVMGDEKLMSGIITNLILNGIQSVSSEVKPIIQIKLTIEDDKVLIEIKDNGMGIPEGIKDKVFLPNFSTKYTGSGIGLAVAKRGVEHAGGKIWFQTMESTGTSFFIELPVI